MCSAIQGFCSFVKLSPALSPTLGRELGRLRFLTASELGSRLVIEMWRYSPPRHPDVYSHSKKFLERVHITIEKLISDACKFATNEQRIVSNR